MKQRQDQRSWGRKRIVPSGCRIYLGSGAWHWGMLADLSPAGAGLRVYAATALMPKKYARGILKIGTRQYSFSVAWATTDPVLGPDARSFRLGVRFDQPNVEVFQRRDLADSEIPVAQLFFEARVSSEPPTLISTMRQLGALAEALDAATEMLLILSATEAPERFAVFEPRLRVLDSKPTLHGRLELAADMVVVLTPAVQLSTRHAAPAVAGDGTEPVFEPARVLPLSSEDVENFRRQLTAGLEPWRLPADAFAAGSAELIVLEGRLLPALQRLGEGPGGLQLGFEPRKT